MRLTQMGGVILLLLPMLLFLIIALFVCCKKAVVPHVLLVEPIFYDDDGKRNIMPYSDEGKVIWKTSSTLRIPERSSSCPLPLFMLFCISPNVYF